MAQIQFSVIKKIKIGRLEHSLPPTTPKSDNILKENIMCINPKNTVHLVLFRIE